MKRKLHKVLCTTALLLLLQTGTGQPTPAVAQTLAVATPAASDAIDDKRPIVHPDGVKFGAYDPHGDFGAQADVSTEHLFLPWEDVDLDTLKTADDYARKRGRSLLITVEPWSWSVEARISSRELRNRLLRGDYDQNMQAIAEKIAELKSPVTVRWGQEMEDTSGRFTWSGWEPVDYVRAYRRMADIVRREAPNAKLMWSPKGLPALTLYYPGDSYVDVVGLSVFGLEAYDKRVYGAPRSFADALKPGYKLVERYKKPIWVAELGYEGDARYVNAWKNTSTLKQADFPMLAEVVYFNDRDVHEWPDGMGMPDWRVVDEGAGRGGCDLPNLPQSKHCPPT